VTADSVTEPSFVPVFLDDHCIELRCEVVESERRCGLFGGDVLADVLRFETACGVHRPEPTTHETKRAEEPADDGHADLAWSSRSAAEFGQHDADLRAVMPFRLLDPLYLRALVRPSRQRTPMRAIGVRRSELTSMRVLQDPDQPPAL
jgi:hypothetical protein